jgi:hypothetical protein
MNFMFLLLAARVKVLASLSRSSLSAPWQSFHFLLLRRIKSFSIAFSLVSLSLRM